MAPMINKVMDTYLSKSSERFSILKEQYKEIQPSEGMERTKQLEISNAIHLNGCLQGQKTKYMASNYKRSCTQYISSEMQILKLKGAESLKDKIRNERIVRNLGIRSIMKELMVLGKTALYGELGFI